MPIYQFDGLTPVVDPDAFVHPDAVLIGDVVIGTGCFVGPGACLRGDLARITVGPGSNVQDNVVVHSFPGGDVTLEADSHIGHGAVLHGCTVRHAAMVGIAAVVMDHAIIGEQAIVAAMAFVNAQMLVPPRSLALGCPARIVRPLRPDEIAWKAQATTHYQHLARRYAETARRVEPLPALEPDRRRLPTDGPSARPPR